MVSIVQTALFVAFFIVLASSIFITSLFRLKSITQYILSIYLLSFANIILVSELAGLFNRLNDRFFFLGIHSLILFFSIIIWKKWKMPLLFTPVQNVWKEIRSKNLWMFFTKNPLLVILGLAVFVFYLINLLLIMKVAPNNYDGLVAYIARIGYWLQHGNFKPWPTWNIGQTQYPLNAQIQIMWSILFWRTDTFAGIVQWFAAVFGVVSIFGMARLMQKTFSQSLFAALIFSLFPIILLESTSVQSHLCGSSLVLISFYFLLNGYKSHSKRLLFFSGLGFGLALGVHGIFLFMLPGYLLSIFYLALKEKKWKFIFLRTIFISFILSFLILGSYSYIQNTVFYQSPLGGNLRANAWSPLNSNQFAQEENYWLPQNFLKYTFYNFCKYSFASFDLTGIPEQIAIPLYKLRDLLYIPLFEITKNPLQHGEFDIFVHVPAVSENWAWFGMVGYLLFHILFILELIRAIIKKDAFRFILIGNIFFYTLIWAGLLAREDGWHMYSSRYFIPVGLLFSPLIATVYQKRIVNKIVTFFIILASVGIAFFVTRDNYAKPLFSNGAILQWTRLEQIYQVGWDQYPVIVEVEKDIPKDAKLGLLLHSNIEYPLFGEYFTRTLITIFPYETINNSQWIIQNDIEWILSCVDSVKDPENFTLVSFTPYALPIGQESSGCKIYRRNE